MELLFSEKVGSSFADKVKTISSQLGIDPNWLMFVMNYESGGSFSPSKGNNVNPPCRGLIQFCSDEGTPGYKTIGGRKYSLTEIANMSADQQLDLVYEFYKPTWIRKHLDSYQALYLATLTPGYLDEIDNDGFVFPGWVVSGNPSFFKTGSTMGDFKKAMEGIVYKTVPTRFYDSFFEEKSSASEPTVTKKTGVTKIYRREIIITIAIVALLIALWFVGKKLMK